MPQITEGKIEKQLEETLPGIDVAAIIEGDVLDIEYRIPESSPLELKRGKSRWTVSGSVDEVEEQKDEFIDMYFDSFTQKSLKEVGVELPSKLEKRTENFLRKTYGEEFRITAKETDSEIEVVMKVKRGARDKYERDEVWFPVITPGRDWEDIVEDLGTFARMDVNNATKIGYLWNIKTIARKSGKYGVDEAARVMRARCDAGAIVGCTMYTRLLKDWIGKALSVVDWAAFSPYIEGFRYSGEEDMADALEERFEDMPEDMPTDREIREWEDDFESLMEERVGRPIPREPGDTTRSEREESKRIAIEVGEARREKRKFGRSASKEGGEEEKKEEGKEFPGDWIYVYESELRPIPKALIDEMGGRYKENIDYQNYLQRRKIGMKEAIDYDLYDDFELTLQKAPEPEVGIEWLADVLDMDVQEVAKTIVEEIESEQEGEIYRIIGDKLRERDMDNEIMTEELTDKIKSQARVVVREGSKGSLTSSTSKSEKTHTSEKDKIKEKMRERMG